MKGADTTLLSPCYANDAAFDGSVRQSVAELELLMDWGTDWVYFPDPVKSLFIVDNPEEKKTAKS